MRMKKYEGLKALYVGSHSLFTEETSAVYMLKMRQAMANPVIDAVEWSAFFRGGNNERLFT